MTVANVVSISEAPSHPDRQPHLVEQVMCTECGHWSVDVRPLETPLEICECAGCRRVGTLEVLTLREVKLLARLVRLEARVAALDGRTA